MEMDGHILKGEVQRLDYQGLILLLIRLRRTLIMHWIIYNIIPEKH